MSHNRQQRPSRGRRAGGVRLLIVHDRTSLPCRDGSTCAVLVDAGRNLLAVADGAPVEMIASGIIKAFETRQVILCRKGGANA